MDIMNDRSPTIQRDEGYLYEHEESDGIMEGKGTVPIDQT